MMSRAALPPSMLRAVHDTVLSVRRLAGYAETCCAWRPTAAVTKRSQKITYYSS
jgi:hypothetical protein